MSADPFAPSLAGQSFDLPPLATVALEVEGFLIPPAELAPGAPVGEIVLYGPDGETAAWTLRAGLDLAAWSEAPGEPADPVRRVPVVVRTWPALFGEPPNPRPGHTYQARHELAQPLEARFCEVRALIPAACLYLERLWLIGPAGERHPVAPLIGQGDHVLAYCSPGVAIYRNLGAGPRAFLVHRTRLARSEAEARRILIGPTFAPQRETILRQGQELAGEPTAGDEVRVEAYEPEYVRLWARTATQAYLVLADSDYPGWVAHLDGEPVAIERADLILRAVAVPPGEHVVEFRFRPQSQRVGQLVSLASGVLVGAVAGWQAIRFLRR